MPTATRIGIRYVLVALAAVLVVQGIAMGYAWLAHGSPWQTRALNPGVVAGVFAACIFFASRHAYAAGVEAGSATAAPQARQTLRADIAS